MPKNEWILILNVYKKHCNQHIDNTTYRQHVALSKFARYFEELQKDKRPHDCISCKILT